DAAGKLARASEGARQEARQQQGKLASELASTAETVGGFKVILAEVPIGNPKEILAIAKQAQAESGASAVLAGTDPESGKVGMVALLAAEDVTRASARELIASAAPEIGGGGGGSEEMAQAGGRRKEGIAAALAVARKYLESR
ncbi:MAG: hypothetical protein IT199_00550, partial [Solirubrobacterales bacterium]|nr:hypothetical protein [Solirubrobacterales bacterium]